MSRRLTPLGEAVVLALVFIAILVVVGVIYTKGRLDGLNYARTVVCDHKLASYEHPALCSQREE